MVKNLSSPGSEILLNGVEERGVRVMKRDIILGWVSNQALTALGMLECHIVACDHDTLYCQKYWHPLLMNRFDYFSNFYEAKTTFC